jgi:hypothetical protein
MMECQAPVWPDWFAVNDAPIAAQFNWSQAVLHGNGYGPEAFGMVAVKTHGWLWVAVAARSLA